MNSIKERCKHVAIKYPVGIPSPDGESIAYSVEVEVSALRDPVSGETFLTGEARKEIERVKARHMGLMLSEEIKLLRERLVLTQKEMSELLQIGEKTYTRWESGGSYPSRSMNLLLCALRDGRIDVNYLRTIKASTAQNVWLDFNVSDYWVLHTNAVQIRSHWRSSCQLVIESLAESSRITANALHATRGVERFIAMPFVNPQLTVEKFSRIGSEERPEDELVNDQQ